MAFASECSFAAGKISGFIEGHFLFSSKSGRNLAQEVCVSNGGAHSIFAVGGRPNWQFGKNPTALSPSDGEREMLWPRGKRAHLLMNELVSEPTGEGAGRN